MAELVASAPEGHPPVVDAKLGSSKLYVEFGSSWAQPGTALLAATSSKYVLKVKRYDKAMTPQPRLVPRTRTSSWYVGSAFFTFTLDVFYSSDHTGEVPKSNCAGHDFIFQGLKSRPQSDAPNLDLFPTSCWSSKSSSPASSSGKFTLITNG
ncbi:hypothetical protein OS493_039733, partial [Desmophyllum pertusum]